MQNGAPPHARFEYPPFRGPLRRQNFGALPVAVAEANRDDDTRDGGGRVVGRIPRVALLDGDSAVRLVTFKPNAATAHEAFESSDRIVAISMPDLHWHNTLRGSATRPDASVDAYLSALMGVGVWAFTDSQALCVNRKGALLHSFRLTMSELVDQAVILPHSAFYTSAGCPVHRNPRFIDLDLEAQLLLVLATRSYVHVLDTRGKPLCRIASAQGAISTLAAGVDTTGSYVIAVATLTPVVQLFGGRSPSALSSMHRIVNDCAITAVAMSTAGDGSLVLLLGDSGGAVSLYKISVNGQAPVELWSVSAAAPGVGPSISRSVALLAVAHPVSGDPTRGRPIAAAVAIEDGRLVALQGAPRIEDGAIVVQMDPRHIERISALCCVDLAGGRMVHVLTASYNGQVTGYLFRGGHRSVVESGTGHSAVAVHPKGTVALDSGAMLDQLVGPSSFSTEQSASVATVAPSGASGGRRAPWAVFKVRSSAGPPSMSSPAASDSAAAEQRKGLEATRGDTLAAAKEPLVLLTNVPVQAEAGDAADAQLVSELAAEQESMEQQVIALQRNVETLRAKLDRERARARAAMDADTQLISAAQSAASRMSAAADGGQRGLTLVSLDSILDETTTLTTDIKVTGAPERGSVCVTVQATRPLEELFVLSPPEELFVCGITAHPENSAYTLELGENCALPARYAYAPGAESTGSAMVAQLTLEMTLLHTPRVNAPQVSIVAVAPDNVAVDATAALCPHLCHYQRVLDTDAEFKGPLPLRLEISGGFSHSEALIALDSVFAGLPTRSASAFSDALVFKHGVTGCLVTVELEVHRVIVRSDDPLAVDVARCGLTEHVVFGAADLTFGVVFDGPAATALERYFTSVSESLDALRVVARAQTQGSWLEDYRAELLSEPTVQLGAAAGNSTFQEAGMAGAGPLEVGSQKVGKASDLAAFRAVFPHADDPAALFIDPRWSTAATPSALNGMTAAARETLLQHELGHALCAWFRYSAGATDESFFASVHNSVAAFIRRWLHDDVWAEHELKATVLARDLYGMVLSLGGNPLGSVPSV